MLARVRSIAQMIFRRARWEQELRDELQFHIEQRAEHLARTGLPREEALRRARIEFGGVERFKEGCRDARGSRWIDECSRNLGYALRSVRRNPGFTAVAVLSLALGIGANLAIFGVLHRLVLAKLPVRDPDGLYQLAVVSGSGTAYTLPVPKFELMRGNLPFLTPMFGWGGWPIDLAAGEYRRKVQVAAVTANYFEALGLQPRAGRLFTSQDGHAHTPDIAVISFDLWQTAFARESAVLTSPLRLGDATFTVIGVAPPGFSGTESSVAAGVYLPLDGFDRVVPGVLQRPNMAWFHAMTRLRRDVPLDAARAVLREQWARLDEPNRARRGRSHVDSLVLEDGSRGYSAVRLEFSRAILVLMGLVAAVFLIACANLATLLFVRGAARTREISIRLALGASRAQLVRQWMTECLLLSAMGGVAGLLAARWITDLLLNFVAEADRPWLRFQATPTIIGVSVLLTMAAALLFGLLPVVHATRASADAALRSQSGAATARRGVLAQGILAGQFAASLVLVVGAALFARTLWNLNAATGGFDRKAVVYGIPDFSTAHVPEQRRTAVVSDVVERLNRSPHVGAISMGSPPMVWGESGWWWVRDTDYVPGPDEDNTVFLAQILPGYFDVLGIPLMAGRDFQQRDRPAAGKPGTVVIVNEHLARRYFPKRSAIGQKLTLQTTFEIIGIVSDTKNKSLRDPQKDLIYSPVPANQWSALVARPAVGVAAAVVEAEVRAAFTAVWKDLPVDTGLLEQAVQRSLGRDRMVAQLSATLGVLGVLLACVGLYAAIRHSVSSRTREIGIRMALGAAAPDVMWMVMKQSLFITAMGVLMGLPGAIVGSRIVSSLLFDIAPSDPLTLVVSASVLVLVGFLAGWWPARSAARLNPSHALRYE